MLQRIADDGPHPFVPETGLRLPVGITLLPLLAAGQPWYGGQKPRGIYDRPLAFPGLSFAVVIHRRGFFARVIHAFGMDKRLEFIFQLQRLTAMYVGWDAMDAPNVHHTFPHKRLFDHSIPAALMNVCAHYLLGHSEREMQEACLGTLIHDNEIPAGGDAMKALDPSIANLTLFDEDLQVPNSFDRFPERIERLSCDFGLSQGMVERVTQAVQGIGVNGMLHKIADTTSYLMCDVAQMMRWHLASGIDHYEHHESIYQLATPRAFRAWESITVMGGLATLGDVKGTYELIALHLRLWLDLYNNTGHKVLEHLHTGIIYPWLFKIGALTTHDLKHWHDGNLYQRVSDVFGMDGLGGRLDSFSDMPKRIVFHTLREALHMESKISSMGHFTILVEPSLYPLVSVRTRKFWVVDTEGKAGSFADVYPAAAADIERDAARAKATTRFELIVFPRPRLTPELAMAWQHARRRWHEGR